MPQWRPLGKLDAEAFDTLPEEELAARCGGDAEASARLYPVVKQEIRRLGLEKIWSLAMDVLPILAEMGGRGMAVHRDHLANRVRRLGQWLQHAKPALEAELGIKNVGSHEQLAEALYSPVWQATALRKTTKGYSTDRTSLLWARYQARQKKDAKLQRILTRLLKYSTTVKVYSTYYKPWLSIGEGLRVYSNYALGRTATGRLSSYDENLQNVPESVRALIIPSDGYDAIVQADFRQLELCTAAHLSSDPVLCDWIRRGRDIHALQAARVLGLKEPTTPDEIAQFKKDHNLERQIGKRANFATLYGVTAETLAWQTFTDSDGEIWISPDDIQPYIDAFFTTFQGWKTHTDRLREGLRRGDAVVSPTGRIWWLPDTEAGWRCGCNYPVQSLASDLVLLALRSLAHILWRDGWRTRLIGEVHDSLVLEAPKNELPRLYKLLKVICENISTKQFGFTLNVPLAIEIKSGPSWGSLQPA